MDAQIAMSILMYTIGEAVRRIGPQPEDQCEGRDERDQTIAASGTHNPTSLA
jgi:hypothetical protein